MIAHRALAKNSPIVFIVAGLLCALGAEFENYAMLQVGHVIFVAGCGVLAFTSFIGARPLWQTTLWFAGAAFSLYLALDISVALPFWEAVAEILDEA
jgi:hypothetical protein